MLILTLLAHKLLRKLLKCNMILKGYIQPCSSTQMFVRAAPMFLDLDAQDPGIHRQTTEDASL